MSKAEAIKAVLEQGTFSVGEIAQKTGYPVVLVSVYLSQYKQKWGITKSGVRRSYRYGIGSTGSGGTAGEVVAEQNASA